MIRPEIRAWLGPETRFGVEPVFATEGMNVQALWFESDIGSRPVGIDQAVQSHAGRGGAGRSVDGLFAGGLAGVEALGPRPGAAVLASELARMSREAVDLGGLNLIEYFWCETLPSHERIGLFAENA